MASTPQYAAVPLPPSSAVPGTSTLLTGASAVELIRGATPGVVVEKVSIQALGTTAAGMIRFFISPDSGTTKSLIAEVFVSAIPSLSGPAQAFAVDVPKLEGLSLASSAVRLYCTTHIGDSFIITAFAGSL